MYRYQTHVQVQNGHWREFRALLKELNATMGAKGLVPFQVWESSFGPFLIAGVLYGLLAIRY